MMTATRSLWVLVAVLTLSAPGCSMGDTQEGGAAAADSAATAETSGASAMQIDRDRTIPVAVAPLATGEAAEIIKAWGTVAPWQEARLLAGASGTVTQSPAALGRRVGKDAVLVAVDPALHGTRVDEAKARLAAAETGLRVAERNLERAKSLHQNQEISEVDLEKATVEHAAAQAEEAAARAGLEQARVTYRDARPVAPFAGVVANNVPDAGTSVNAGELLVHLVDLDRVKVMAELSEQDILRIEEGATASVRVEGADRVFEGTVRGLGPQADPDSRQFPVEIEVPNPGHQLRGGMVARIEIVLQRYHDVPLLPVGSLVERGGKLGFYVIDKDTARWRDVTFGPRTNSHVSVLSGAQAGEQVVIMGQTRLQDGAKVRLEEAP